MIALNPRKTKEQTRAFVQECPLQEYDEVTRSSKLKNLEQRINGSQNDGEQRKLKGYLPFRCPHYTRFLDNYRDREHIAPESFTWQTCVDIDDPDKVELANTMSEMLDAEEGGLWKGMMLHKDYSIRRKLHIDIRLPMGMTVPEAQRAYCKALGVECDTSCFTPERFIYISPADFEIFRAEGWCEPLSEEEVAQRRKAYTDRGLSIDGRTANGAYYDPAEEGESSVTSLQCYSAEESNNAIANDPEAKYNGMLFTDIVAKYWELFNGGKVPEEGDRNVQTFELAVSLRSICGFSMERLMQVVPNYWIKPDGTCSQEDWAEWSKTLENALKEPHKGMPYRMKQVLQALKSQAGVKACGGTPTAPPPMPKRLPPLVRLLTKNVPDFYKPAVASAVFPALGAHLHGVKFRYWDNVDHEATFMNVLIGRQSIGKGSIKKPIEYIMEDIRQRDIPNRQREQEWKQKNPSAKQKKEPRPTDICIQMLIDNLTDAIFNQRVIDAHNNGQRFIYTLVDEIEGLKKVTSKGTADEVGLLIRKAYDNSDVGQERYGSDSVSGIAPLRWNWNASTTPPNARRFFGRMVNDGTVSRLDVATIILDNEDEDTAPILGIYDNSFAQELKPYIDRLEAANGLIECSQAKKLSLDMKKENSDAARLYDSEAYKILSYRANVIAWLKGMVLYVAHGYKWSREIAEFVRWTEQYNLWCKMLYFGQQLEKELREEVEIQRQGGTQNMLELLKDEFTREEYLLMRQQQGRPGDGASTLRQWVSRGYIAYDEACGRYCKTEEYKRKFKV